MKTVFGACLVALALVLAQQPTIAQTAKFRYLASIYADDKGAGLNGPEGVACGPAGRIVVADTGHDRLVRFTWADKAVTGGAPIQVPQLKAPSRVLLNSKGDIYALDSRERRLVRLGPEGEFKEAVSFAGAPPPTTVVPKSVAIDASDRVYVLDVFSGRVLVVDAQGQFQRALPLPDGVGFGSELAIDEAGGLFLLDSIKRAVFAAGRDAPAFAPLEKSPADAIATMPTALAVSKGTIFVVEGPGGRIVSLRRDGSFVARQLASGRDEGALSQPSQMCINDRDEVFVADRDNSRIQVFQLIR